MSIKPVCPECGGDIWSECLMYWDEYAQKFVPDSAESTGLYSCEICDFETKSFDNLETINVY